MSKKNVIQLEAGKVYHIFNRGIAGDNLFRADSDYGHFLKLYEKYCAPVMDTYAYCLLGNHFHILARVKESLPNYASLYPEIKPEQQNAKALELVDPIGQFGHLFNAYARKFNHTFKPKRTGGLFEEPFQRILVDSESYFSEMVRYVHFNPQKHGFVNDFKNYPYSSYHNLLSQKPTFLARAEVLDLFGGRDEFAKFHLRDSDEDGLDKFLFEE